jgi:hypothetical protein
MRDINVGLASGIERFERSPLPCKDNPSKNLRVAPNREFLKLKPCPIVSLENPPSI